MTIKLNLQQLEHVHYLLTEVLEQRRPADIAEKLLHEIVDKINERMRTRIRSRQNGSIAGTTFKLSPIEAMGFYTWYLQIGAAYFPDQYLYERNAIDSEIMNKIDREYA